MPSTRTATIAIALAAGLLLGACGTPPWRESTGASDTPTSTSSPTSSEVTPTPTPTPVSTPSRSASVRNDLATGSLTRKVLAGNVRLDIDYWSTLDRGKWTPAANKPLNLSASARFTDDSDQDIFLSSVRVNAVAQTPAGAKSLTPVQDVAKVSPGYLVTAPTSYGQVFTIPPSPQASTSVTITLTYQLLVQSAPKSKVYSRQAASDTLSVPLA